MKENSNMTQMCPRFLLAKLRNTSPGKIQHNLVASRIIAHYGCHNNHYTVKFAIIIHLKVICHFRIGTTPSKTMVYAEFYHGLRQ